MHGNKNPQFSLISFFRLTNTHLPDDNLAIPLTCLGGRVTGVGSARVCRAMVKGITFSAGAYY